MTSSFKSFHDLTRPAFFAILLLGMAAIGLFSTHSATAAGLTATEEANEKLVRDFYVSMVTLDSSKMTAHMADDFTNTAFGKTIKGKENFAQNWDMMIQNVKKQKVNIIRLTAIGNTVTVERKGTIYGNFSNDRTEVTFHLTNFFYIVDGKIKEMNVYRMPK